MVDAEQFKPCCADLSHQSKQLRRSNLVSSRWLTRNIHCGKSLGDNSAAPRQQPAALQRRRRLRAGENFCVNGSFNLDCVEHTRKSTTRGIRKRQRKCLSFPGRSVLVGNVLSRSALRLLSLAAQKRGHIEIVGRDFLHDVADVARHLLHHVGLLPHALPSFRQE